MIYILKIRKKKKNFFLKIPILSSIFQNRRNILQIQFSNIDLVFENFK